MNGALLSNGTRRSGDPREFPLRFEEIAKDALDSPLAATTEPTHYSMLRGSTGNGYSPQNGDAFEKSDVNTENDGQPHSRLEDQELLDGWARLAPSGESLSMFVRSLGVKGLRMDQWYNVDVPEAMDGCVYGLIFLYKWRVDRGKDYKRKASVPTYFASSDSSGSDPNDVMFLNQFVNSGSATQGVVTALLNLPLESGLSAGVELGAKLSELREFCHPLTPVVRSAAVSSSACVHEAHNTAAANQSLFSDRRSCSDANASEEFWMYTVYIPGRTRRWVYELDGCANDFTLIGRVDSVDTADVDSQNRWVGVVTEPLEQRVKELRQHRVPFQLYALVDDVPLRASKAGEAGEDEIGASKDLRASPGQNGFDMKRDVSAFASKHAGEARHRFGSYVPVPSQSPPSTNRQQTATLYSEEEHTVASHDYENFFVEMLKLMASKGQLNDLMSNACLEPSSFGNDNVVDRPDDVAHFDVFDVDRNEAHGLSNEEATSTEE